MRNPEDHIRLVYDRLPLIIRLPVTFDRIGLGDVVARVLAAVGLRATPLCRCHFRQAVLNSYVIFYGRYTPVPQGPSSRWSPAIGQAMAAQTLSVPSLRSLSVPLNDGTLNDLRVRRTAHGD